jgi:hypothetical protein
MQLNRLHGVISQKMILFNEKSVFNTAFITLRWHQTVNILFHIMLIKLGCNFIVEMRDNNSANEIDLMLRTFIFLYYESLSKNYLSSA